jgi:hypothetical protein
MTFRSRLKRLETRDRAPGRHCVQDLTDVELERLAGIDNPTDAQLEEIIRRPKRTPDREQTP